MAGHSHWANIQYRKAAVDARKGKILSKIARLIISAAKQGGGSPESNLKLRYALEKARQASMPKDTIERAIKKGTGELEGLSFEEVVYEGYGPSGVAVMVDVLTDNRHRTSPEMKKLFETHGGNLGASGSVAWMFEKRGLIQLPRSAIEEEKLLDVAIEAGAEDVVPVGENFQITVEPGSFLRVKAALEGAKLPLASAEVTQMPKSTVALGAEVARKVLALMEELDNHDDVQQTYANFEIPAEVLQEIGK